MLDAKTIAALPRNGAIGGGHRQHELQVFKGHRLSCRCAGERRLDTSDGARCIEIVTNETVSVTTEREGQR